MTDLFAGMPELTERPTLDDEAEHDQVNGQPFVTIVSMHSFVELVDAIRAALIAGADDEDGAT